MSQKNRIEIPRIVACRGDEELLVERTNAGLSFLSDLEIVGKLSATSPVARELKAGGGEDANAHRLELIQQLRSGTHLEIMVKRALAYRQPKGKPNRRHLRFAADQLEHAAGSWRGQPLLVDHNTYEQDKRKGTILTSEMSEDSRGAPAFYMGFSVVKPDAAISVLDGTIDRFSIGWFSTGPVLCTAHGCDIRGLDSCGCWPGEKVLVDGKEKIVEYEYQSFAGKELSAVNVPAVIGTRIEEFHQALTAELDLPERRTPPKEHKTMASLPRLAAVLGLTALTDSDEDRAVTIAEGFRQGKLAAEQERDTARTQLAAAEKTRDEALAARDAGRTDDLIAGAYRDGKLRYGRDEDGKAIPSAREARLRTMAKRDGLDALAAEVAELEIVVPVGQRSALDTAREPAKTEHGPAALSDADIAATAAQLGVPVADMRARLGLAAGGSQ